MQTNVIVIGVVVILAIALIVYLIRQNQKDKKEVTAFLNKDTSDLEEEESELNNER